MNKRFALVFNVSHLEVVAELIEQLKRNPRAENIPLIFPSLPKSLCIYCDSQRLETLLLSKTNNIQGVLRVLHEVKL